MERGLYVYAHLVSPKLASSDSDRDKEKEIQFHERLLEKFGKLKANVEKLYGQRPSLLPPNSSLEIMIPKTKFSVSKQDSIDNLLSNSGDKRSSGGQQISTNDMARGISFRNPMLSAAFVSSSFTSPKNTYKRRKSDKEMISKRLSNSSLNSQGSAGSSSLVIELTQTVKRNLFIYPQ